MFFGLYMKVDTRLWAYGLCSRESHADRTHLSRYSLSYSTFDDHEVKKKKWWSWEIYLIFVTCERISVRISIVALLCSFNSKRGWINFMHILNLFINSIILFANFLLNSKIVIINLTILFWKFPYLILNLCFI